MCAFHSSKDACVSTTSIDEHAYQIKGVYIQVMIIWSFLDMPLEKLFERDTFWYLNRVSRIKSSPLRLNVENSYRDVKT